MSSAGGSESHQDKKSDLSRVHRRFTRAEIEDRERIARILDASDDLSKRGLLAPYPLWGELLGHIHAMDAATRNFLVLRLRRCETEEEEEHRYREASSELIARADHRRQLISSIIRIFEKGNSETIKAELYRMIDRADGELASHDQGENAPREES